MPDRQRCGKCRCCRIVARASVIALEAIAKAYGKNDGTADHVRIVWNDVLACNPCLKWKEKPNE